jgi:hypothetical protein
MAEGDVCSCAQEFSKLLERVFLALRSISREDWASSKMELQDVKKRLKDFEDCLGTKLGLEQTLKDIEDDVDKGNWTLAMSGFYNFMWQLPLRACKKW